MLTCIARKKGSNIIIPIPMDMARAADIYDGTLVAYEMFGNRITIKPAATAKQEDSERATITEAHRMTTKSPPDKVVIWARKE